MSCRYLILDIRKLRTLKQMTNSPMRAVVTGGAGFIGFHLAKRLASLGWEVHLVDMRIPSELDREFHQFIVNSRIQFHMVDLTNSEQLNNLPDTDYVFHFAALNGTQNFYRNPYKVLVNSGIPIIALMNRYMGRARFIYAGSSESYAPGVKYGIITIPTSESAPFVIDDPTNPRWSYSMGKSFGEIACQAYGSEFGKHALILRFHNVYGPRMGINHVIPDLLLNALEGKYVLNGWKNTRSFVFIDDAINDVIELATKFQYEKTEVVNLGSEEEITMLELGSILLKLMHIEAEFELRDAPLGSVSRRRPDLTLLTTLLGNRSRVSLVNGLEQTLGWYRANRKLYRD